MAWTFFGDSLGKAWEINQLGLWLLCRHHAQSAQLKTNSRVVRERRIIGPDAVNVEIDWKAVTSGCNKDSQELYKSLEAQAIVSGSATLSKLIKLREEVETFNGDAVNLQQSTSAEFQQNLNKSIERGEVVVEVAKAVRDASATTLVIGSAFISGGASLVVLGGGSYLKGVAKYQDTGNVGGAVFEGASTFIVGVIPLGGQLTSVNSALPYATKYAVSQEVIDTMATWKMGDRLGIVFVGATVDGTAEGMKALIDGKSGAQALSVAGARFGIDVVTGGIGFNLDKMGLPITTRLITDTITTNAGDSFVGGVGALVGPSANGSSTNDPPPALKLPQPTSVICDSNSLLSTGNCKAADWINQIVLRPAKS